MDVTQDLQDLLAERAIYAKLAQYCRGVDRKQWDLVEDCYHEDAVDSHGAYEGDVKGFIEFLQNRHAHVGSSMHVLGTTTITFADDRRRARSESYCIAYQNPLPGGDDPFAGAGDDQAGAWVSIGVRYVDTFELRESTGWKILRRTVVYEWVRQEDAANYTPLDPDWVAFRRDESDSVFSPLQDR